jgi:hypothetical protein
MLLSLVVALTALGSPDTPAAKTPPNPQKAALTQARPAELPARAAEIVAGTQTEFRAETTRNVVVAAHELNPGALMSVVGAIAKSTPDMAPSAAAAAAAREPRMARFIARSAALAAPRQAGSIAQAVTHAVPDDAREIALAVALAAPGSDQAVLQGLQTGVPTWKPYIDQSLAALPANQHSAGTVLAHAGRLMTASSTAARNGQVAPPVVGPPFQALPSPPAQVAPNPANQVPDGWQRQYSRP